MQCNVKLVDAGFVLDQLASHTIMCISTQKLKPYTLLSMVHYCIVVMDTMAILCIISLDRWQIWRQQMLQKKTRLLR